MPLLQAVRIPKITILVSHKTTEYTIKVISCNHRGFDVVHDVKVLFTKVIAIIFDSQDLSPFTTYHVNVSAIPEDRSYRPPAKITVTTQVFSCI